MLKNACLFTLLYYDQTEGWGVVRGYISQRDKLFQNRLRVRKTRERKRVEENQTNKACLMERVERAP